MISDNGPQFIACDCRDFIGVSCLMDVRPAPHSPQSNREIERFKKTLNATTIRPEASTRIEATRLYVTASLSQYNTERLHGTLVCITPAHQLARRSDAMWATRDQRLEAARRRRVTSRHTVCTIAIVRPPACHIHANQNKRRFR